MIISREVDINVNRYGLRVVIPVVQYDSGRQIIFNIVDAELPSGCTSNIFIKKPSGKSVYNTCTVSGNKVTVTLTNQSLSEYGFNDAQIQIIKGEEVVTSFSFILEVKQSDADNAVISKSESTFFQGIVNKAQAAATTAERVLDSIPDDYSQMSTKVNTNTTAISVLNSNAYMLKGGIAIPANADLNTETYCVYGTYYASSYTIATSLANCPARTVFRMIVTAMTSGDDQNYHYVKRTIISGTNESDYNEYTQICQKGGPGKSWVFGSWKLEPTRSEVNANTNAIDALNSSTIPWASYDGQLEVTIDDTSFSGISTFAKSLINGNVGKKWITVRVNSSTSAPKVEPFYGASFGLTINCSSVNYGWGWLQSDNAQNQVYYGRLSAGTWTWYKVGKQADIDTNANAIATNKTSITTNTNAIATLNNNLGGYKLVGYTASVVLNKAGEFIIPYPSGESFGTVYGILSATFLQGGYCLPNPPLTPSSTSPAYDISAAVAFRILSTGIAIYTGGAWGADSRDIYFVLICKA